jgi:hypothetical protein
MKRTFGFEVDAAGNVAAVARVVRKALREKALMKRKYHERLGTQRCLLRFAELSEILRDRIAVALRDPLGGATANLAVLAFELSAKLKFQLLDARQYLAANLLQPRLAVRVL